MRLNAVLAGTGLLLALLAPGPCAFAQEEAAEESGGEEQQSKIPFGLYVEAATGVASARDLDTSITTLSTHQALTSLSLEDQMHVRAALGWRLPHGKGDFRIRFDGFNDDGYTLSSRGVQATLDLALDVDASVTENLDWWALDVQDGIVHAVRTPPVWDPWLDDLNGNQSVEREEVHYPNIDMDFTSSVVADLQNQAQSIDLLYGRTFGEGRYTGRWWGGFRHFVYEGNILSSAWLLTTPTGEGFTENALLPLLSFYNKTSSFGPMGAIEADFNFFDGRLALYLQGQFAFMMTDLSVDSGRFTTFVEILPAGGELRYLIPVDAHLTETRTKSTWQDAAEAGIRFTMRNGLQLELAYQVTGYLDVILLPSRISIPDSRTAAPQGVSALYRTQDYVLEGWRAGVAFQF